MTVGSSVPWASIGTTLGVENLTTSSPRKSSGAVEVAERILGYRLVAANVPSAMGAWLYADEALRIAESFLGATLEVWPEY